MRLNSLLVLALAICLLASCGKHSHYNTAGTTTRIKTYIETYPHNGGTDTFNLYYDDQNRLIRMAASWEEYDYVYGGGGSFTMDLLVSGRNHNHEVAFIKDGVHVDSTVQIDNTHDTTTEKYEYKGDLLTRKTVYFYSFRGNQLRSIEDYTYDNNGNLVLDVQSVGSPPFVSSMVIYTYTGYPAKSSLSAPYFPVQSKFLPAQMTNADQYGNVLQTVSYSYLFDASGRVTQETDTYSDGGVGVKRYTFY